MILWLLKDQWAQEACTAHVIIQQVERNLS